MSSPTPVYHHAPVPPSRSAAPMQMIQGVYYVVLGLAVVFALPMVAAPGAPRRPADAWLVRLIGLVIAALGVALFVSGRRAGRMISAGVSLCAAVVLLVLTVACLSMEVVPATFLLDIGFELLFVIFWAVTLINRTSRQVNQATPLPS